MCFKERIFKKFYRKETLNQLNYFSLYVKDPEIRKSIKKHRTNQLYRLFWPMMLGSILSLLVSIFNEFVMKTGHPFYIISNSIIVLLALIMAILKKNGKQELALHLALPYFLISGICSSLVYYDQLPTILS